MKSWKGTETRELAALTGKLQWGHDNEVVEGGSCTCPPLVRLSSFNGATTMKSWKGPFVVLLGRVSISLQWGHDNEVVEGPACRKPWARASRLQWGHDNEVVEGRRRGHLGDNA